MIKPRHLRLCYIAGDFLASNLAWFVFNIFRYNIVDPSIIPATFAEYYNLAYIRMGQILFPVMMMLLYYLSGYYRTVVFKSRVGELLQTLSSTVIGSLIIFLIAIVNDTPGDRFTDYQLIGLLWLLMFTGVYCCRLVISTSIRRLVHRNQWFFNTIVIGNSPDASQLVRKLNKKLRLNGMKIVAFVSDSSVISESTGDIPVYLRDDIPEIISRLNVSRIIVIPERDESPRKTLDNICSLFSYGLPVYVPVSLFHLLFSRPKFHNIIGEPLVNISEANVADSTMCIKRVIDIAVSTVALVILSPVLLIVAAAVRLDSAGPILYLQERIGLHHRPFRIIKFRSMKVDAESDGPTLSCDNDSRVTRVGHFLRKYRIDELPQFINVLRGEMSLVGPRPERAYFIERIMKKAPYYTLVQQVRPGITSLGMVKFGYASTVDEMVERLSYDILYIENISISMDIKIMCYTVTTVLKGRGL